MDPIIGIECPICFEEIGISNIVTTECGHTFHCSCLMKHTTINGYGCPYCREKMAIEENKWENDSDSHEWQDEQFDEEFNDNDRFSDYALTSFRLFCNKLDVKPEPNDARFSDDALASFQWLHSNNEIEEAIDVEEEVEEEEKEEEDDNILYIGEQLSDDVITLSLDDMTNEFMRRKITYKDLIACFIIDYHKTPSFKMTLDFNKHKEVYGKFDTINNTYYEMHRIERELQESIDFLEQNLD